MKKIGLAAAMFFIAGVIAVALAAGKPKAQNFVILIDQSGEMNKTFEKQSLNYLARRVAEEFVRAVPSTIPVQGGIIMYGVQAKDHKNTVVRVLRIHGFNSREFIDAIDNNIKAQTGPSSLSWALKLLRDEMNNAPGNTAVIIISGGNLTDVGKPSEEVGKLKQAYGDRVCIYTVLVGKSDQGRKFLKGVVDDGVCGIATFHTSINSKESMQGFVEQVFFAK